MYVPLLDTDVIRVEGEPNYREFESLRQPETAFAHLAKLDETKGSPFNFLALWDFFRIFFVSKRSPFLFLMVCNKLKFQRDQMVSFLHCLAL